MGWLVGGHIISTPRAARLHGDKRHGQRLGGHSGTAPAAWRSSPPGTGRGQPGGTVVHRAPTPLLGASGHGGLGALQAPRHRGASAGRRHEPAQPRAVQKLPSSRRSIVEPRKITVKGALRASPTTAQAPPLTVDPSRLIQRLSERWQRLGGC